MNAVPSVKMRASVLELQAVMREMPQAEGLVTTHFFADGMYARALFRPAGTLIVGKVHKKEHFYIVARGRVQIEQEVFEAGTVLVSQPGTKRAVLALEDSICLTVHRTDLTVLDAIEKEIVEEDTLALFNSSNELKQPQLSGKVG